MGGTTAKAGTIINGNPMITTEYEVGGAVHAGRIIKGSGYPIRFPFLDLAEVSAGGGSIIWVDSGGALRVGPISAGADPGPACYGLGGKNPTLTDANVILGRLDPEFLLGGEMRIYIKLAKDAFKKEISQLMNLDIETAAIGSIKIANNIKSKILRIVTIERGVDPRDLTLVAFGGAGPIHACDLAEDLQIKRIIIPTVPGLFSAVGLLVTDYKHVFVRSIRKISEDVDVSELQEIFESLEKKGMRILLNENVPHENISFIRYLDMRYWGQGYEILVPAHEKELNLKTLVHRFHEMHERKYGYFMKEEPVEIVNIRVEARGIIKKPKFKKIDRRKHGTVDDAIKCKRNVYFTSHDNFELVNIYQRRFLFAEDIINGPAVIEQYDSTTVINLGWSAKVDDFGNLILIKE